jgi:transposase InsO family protein
MDLARYVVDAVVEQRRSYREVARAHGVSKSWVAKLVARYRSEGDAGLEPRSRAPHRTPHRTPLEVEDGIVALRKELEQGLDAGAQTIWVHLSRREGPVPSVSTIWRILRRRGFVVPEPHKRPRSSWVRFEATLPNECWQSDVTHWRLGDGVEVDICNFLDDHSRLVVAAKVFAVTTSPRAVAAFLEAGERWGFPAALLTDNGCVYTTWHRGGPNAMQVELLERGIEFRHSRPYHPQTCGKVERFHQTLKAYLAKQPRAATCEELQAQVERFVTYYNDVRPHRARGRMTPREAFEVREKARPSGVRIEVRDGVRVRRDRVDRNGKLTLRHKGRLHHIGIGRVWRNTPVVMLVKRLEVRIVGLDGELIRELTLDPNKDYQPLG